ncbi:MAG: preprotein translocase subunit SecG [Candidatus Gracilibacteria bacterium]
MHTGLLIAQIVIGILVTLIILIQEKGSGLGEAIGGTGANYQTVKRGAEKALARTTIVMVALFLGLSLAINFL